MAFPNQILIDALRTTAQRLAGGAYYSWGHHGACNCGNLLQVVGNLSKEKILESAHTGAGEWTELAEDLCSVTGTPAYLMISQLNAVGLTNTDIHHLEYLEDREVLNKLPGGFRWLKRNDRQDVISYFSAMADLLEQKLKSSSMHARTHSENSAPEHNSNKKIKRLRLAVSLEDAIKI